MSRIGPQQEQIIREAAQAHGIPAGVLYGIYGAETDFGRNHNVSSAGARGPFQFMAGTAASLHINPNNFRQAAFGAAKYLAQYKSRGVKGMIAAYNAGPAGDPNNPETRAYVPKVLAFAKELDSGPINLGAAVSRGRASRTTVTPAKTDFEGAAIDALLHHKPGGSLLHAISNRLDSGGYTTPGTVTSSFNHSPKGEASPADALTTVGGGKVTISPTANRHDVNIQPVVIDFLHGLTRWAGAINVGTGTNHNQFVAGEPGVQSEHWTGNAADIPATGKRGDQIAYAAFRNAGVSDAKARLYARNGGVYNFTHNGRHIQILWKTMVGGNHYNHVHVGVH